MSVNLELFMLSNKLGSSRHNKLMDWNATRVIRNPLLIIFHLYWRISESDIISTTYIRFRNSCGMGK